MSAFEILCVTMHQTDFSKLKQMNIHSDVVFANQADRTAFDEAEFEGHRARMITTATRGVGVNRNTALLYAEGDICLFADDDMVYCDGYAQTIAGAFEEHPDADVIVFNLIEPEKTRYVIPKVAKVSYLNFLRYGTARMAIRTAVVRKHGICFNQCFGGGTEHCHGEDNLFLADCLKKGLKVYAVPVFLAELTEERQSSWNTGYGEKYLKDQGVLYRTMSRKYWRLLCLQDVLRHRNKYGMSWLEAYKLMVAGAKTV